MPDLAHALTPQHPAQPQVAENGAARPQPGPQRQPTFPDTQGVEKAPPRTRPQILLDAGEAPLCLYERADHVRHRPSEEPRQRHVAVAVAQQQVQALAVRVRPHERGSLQAEILGEPRHRTEHTSRDELDALPTEALLHHQFDVLDGHRLRLKGELIRIPARDQGHEVNAPQVAAQPVAQRKQVGQFVVVEPLGHAGHEGDLRLGEGAQVLNRSRLQFQGLLAAPQRAVSAGPGAVVGNQDRRPAPDQPAAVVRVRQTQTIRHHPHGQPVGTRHADYLKQVFPHRRLAAEELHGRPGAVVVQPGEDLLEILQRGLKYEAHARCVIDADGAVEVAAVGHVQEHEAGLRLVGAIHTLEVAAHVRATTVEGALHAVAASVAGDQRARLAAGGTLLDQPDPPVCIARLRSHEFSALVA